jgi:hypothetical protein
MHSVVYLRRSLQDHSVAARYRSPVNLSPAVVLDTLRIVLKGSIHSLIDSLRTDGYLWLACRS